MGWASGHIARLQAGETVSCRPRGQSMAGRISSGDLCTVEPVAVVDVDPGDIVLCRVKGTDYLHLVRAVAPDGRVLIGNARGRSTAGRAQSSAASVRVET